MIQLDLAYKEICYITIFLYCSNISVINNDSVEFSCPFASIALEYLYDDCNICSNNSLFCFLNTKEKLYHLSNSCFSIVVDLLLSSDEF